MKKQTKQLIVLLVVLAVCVAGYFAVTQILTRQQAQLEEQQHADDITILSGQIAQISVNAGWENGYTFTYSEEGGWSYTDPIFPVDQGAVDDLAELLVPLSPERVMQAAEPLASYGLDLPHYTVTATDEGGNVLSLLVGDANSNGDFYASLEGDSETIYSLDPALVQLLSKGLLDFMELPELPDLAEADLISVTLEAAGDDPVTITKETIPAETEGDSDTYVWYLDGTPVDQLAPSQDFLDSLAAQGEDPTDAATLLEDLLSALSRLRIDQCADYDDPGRSLLLGNGAQEGDPVPLTATVNYTADSDDGTGEPATLKIYLGGKWSEDDDYYVGMFDDDPAVYPIFYNMAEPIYCFAAAF